MFLELEASLNDKKAETYYRASSVSGLHLLRDGPEPGDRLRVDALRAQQPVKLVEGVAHARLFAEVTSSTKCSIAASVTNIATCCKRSAACGVDLIWVWLFWNDE